MCPKALKNMAFINETKVNLLSLNGRLSGLRYFTYSSCVYVVLGLVGIAVLSMLSVTSLRLLAVMVLLVALVVLLVLSVQRFHDVNAGGWFALFALIPFVPLLLCLIPSSKGVNQFGQPNPPSTIWLTLGALGIGIALIAVLLVLVMAYFVNVVEPAAVKDAMQVID